MVRSYDSVVVGLGAVGSAAAYHLARQGHRVLGLDRFAPPHTLGSSHGESRIIRKAYFEGVRYLPLLERAYTLWRELEEETGQILLRRTGGLNIGPPEGSVVDGTRRAAETHGLAHEVLDATEVQRRFPGFRLPEGHVAVWEPEAGCLDPEACILAHLEMAGRNGATLLFHEPVMRWEPDGDGVHLWTAAGRYRAGSLVLCAGGWISELLPGLSIPLVVARRYNGWFRPRRNARLFAPDRCPVYIWEYEPDTVLYGFPDLGTGVKAGLHDVGEQVDHPDDLQRAPTEEDERLLRRRLQDVLPDACGPLVRSATCFYTLTPDEHYLLDVHPKHPQVVFASACSGHGFKASNAVGEALAAVARGADAPAVEVFKIRSWEERST